LAAIAFADENSRAALNGILHPLIGARTAELVAAAPADAVVIQDIPLLVEGGMAPMFHLVVVVHADAQERVNRLVAQRGMSEGDARARIAAQASDEQRREAADVWLDNSGAPADLESVVDELWTQRLVPFERNLRSRTPVCAQQPVLVAAGGEWPAQARRLIAPWTPWPTRMPWRSRWPRPGFRPNPTCRRRQLPALHRRPSGSTTVQTPGER